MNTIKVKEYLSKNGIDLEKKCLLCCVSGGADSMALLHFFHANTGFFGLRSVCACHLNHCLRGEESDSEEEMLRQFCTENGIRLIAKRLDSIYEGPVTGKSEEYYRDQRYLFFESAKRETGADLIATAHTMNDNVETVLFRLARGTGLKGMSGIPSARSHYIRPLLCVTRSDTERYCSENRVPYKIDSSNLTDDYTRNKIRHHVMPVMRSLNDGYLEAVNSFMSLSSEAEDFFTAAAKDIIRRDSIEGGTLCESVIESPPPIGRYIIREIISGHVRDLNNETVLRCLASVRSGGKVELSKDTYFISDSVTCKVSKKYDRSFEGPFPFEDFTAPDGSRFELIRNVRLSEADIKDLFYYSVDYDKLYGVVSVRNRRDGDRFTSAYRKNTKSLKKLFTEKKYSAEKKDGIILLTDEAGIVWLEEEGPAEGKEIGPDTKNIIKYSNY